MSLFLNKEGHFLNATFSSTTTATTYNTFTPLGTRTTTITCDASDAYGRFRTTNLARIDWNNYSSTVTFHLPGSKVVNIKEFFRKAHWYSSTLIFTAPDGREYRWKLGSKPKLTLNDKTKKLVAQYHPPGRSSSSRISCLEITDEGQSILDYVVLTFIYVKWASRRDDGGGDGDGGDGVHGADGDDRSGNHGCGGGDHGGGDCGGGGDGGGGGGGG